MANLFYLDGYMDKVQDIKKPIYKVLYTGNINTENYPRNSIFKINEIDTFSFNDILKGILLYDEIILSSSISYERFTISLKPDIGYNLNYVEESKYIKSFRLFINYFSNYYEGYSYPRITMPDLVAEIYFYKNFDFNRYCVFQPSLYSNNTSISRNYMDTKADGVIIFDILGAIKDSIDDEEIAIEFYNIVKPFALNFGVYLYTIENQKLNKIFSKIEKMKETAKKQNSYYLNNNSNNYYNYDYDYDYDDGSYEREERELIERSVEHLDDAYEEGYR